MNMDAWVAFLTVLGVTIGSLFRHILDERHERRVERLVARVRAAA